MKDRKRKVDINKMDEATFLNLSEQASAKVRDIIDEAIEKSNKILNIYGLQAKMQVAIEIKEEDTKEEDTKEEDTKEEDTKEEDTKEESLKE